jgi:DNA-binding beta-propeller fold protein YncE
MVSESFGPGMNGYALIDSVQIASARAPAIKVWTAATGVLSTLVTTTNTPSGVAVDAAGNVFYSDGTAVKQRAAATTAVSTILTGSAPRGLATDAAGNVYAADATANVVRKWTASTGGVSTLSAFTGLNGPQAVAVDAAGDVYVADTGNSLIRKWDGADGGVTTLISTGLSRPTGVAIDTLGNVYTVNNGTASSTLDAFQPWADVPATMVTELAAAGSDVLQAVVPVRPDDTPDTLAERVLTQEHIIYPRGRALLAGGRIQVKDERALISGARTPLDVLIAPRV